MTNNKLRTNFSSTKSANIETDFLDIQIKSFPPGEIAQIFALNFGIHHTWHAITQLWKP